MRFYRQLFWIVTGIFFLWSCSHEVHKRVMVIKTNENEISPLSAAVSYKLPLNGVAVQMEVEKESHLAGPYAKYAQKYLGIQNGIIFQNTEYFRLAKVKMESVKTVDDSLTFKIMEQNIAPLSYSLSPEGFLIGINFTDFLINESIVRDSFSFARALPELQFPDLGIKRFVGQKSESQGRTVKTDSSLIKIPYSRKQESVKTPELKAEEAANFIFKLRKRKFKLLAGILEPAQQGLDAVPMAQKLDSIEQSYVELFTGKIVFTRDVYNFFVFPMAGKMDTLLCYFSPNEGLTTDKGHVSETEGREVWSPVFLKFKYPKTKTVSFVPDTCPGIVYREPEVIETGLFINDRPLIEKRMRFSQLGKIKSIPEKYLLNQDYSIEFFQETGALKRLDKKNK